MSGLPLSILESGVESYKKGSKPTFETTQGEYDGFKEFTVSVFTPVNASS